MYKNNKKLTESKLKSLLALHITTFYTFSLDETEVKQMRKCLPLSSLNAVKRQSVRSAAGDADLPPIFQYIPKHED